MLGRALCRHAIVGAGRPAVKPEACRGGCARRVTTGGSHNSPNFGVAGNRERARAVSHPLVVAYFEDMDACVQYQQTNCLRDCSRHEIDNLRRPYPKPRELGQKRSVSAGARFRPVLPRDGRSSRRSPPARESYTKGSRRLPRWLGKPVSQLEWRSTGGRPAIQWKRFCSQPLYRIRPNTLSHSTARQRASPNGPMNSASPSRL